MSGEFDLIKKYFSRVSAQQANSTHQQVLLGVADDCALFTCAQGKTLATSKDLLVEGRHFFSDVDPYLLGHKSLAVNLSDLAAMGAKPIACLLGLGLPRLDETWVSAFADGFYHLSDQFACPLIGGDTTRSENGIIISVTVFGEVSPPYLMRSQAKEGDVIWVSGELGAAHIALQLLSKTVKTPLTHDEQQLLDSTRLALEQPMPRVLLGQALNGIANAMIDISDGLMQDLGHILQQSQVSACIYEKQLPVISLIKSLPLAIVREAVLSGGDVYELCFTAPPSKTDDIQQLAKQLAIPITAIGTILPNTSNVQSKLIVLDENNSEITMQYKGFDHFA